MISPTATSGDNFLSNLNRPNSNDNVVDTQQTRERSQTPRSDNVAASLSAQSTVTNEQDFDFDHELAEKSLKSHDPIEADLQHKNHEMNDNITTQDLDGSNSDFSQPKSIKSIVVPKSPDVHEEKKRRFDETIIDGFAICAFKTWEDLQDELNERISAQIANSTNETISTAPTEKSASKRSVKSKDLPSKAHKHPSSTSTAKDFGSSSGGVGRKRDKSKKSSSGQSSVASKDCSKHKHEQSNITVSEKLKTLKAEDKPERHMPILQQKLTQENNRPSDQNNQHDINSTHTHNGTSTLASTARPSNHHLSSRDAPPNNNQSRDQGPKNGILGQDLLKDPATQTNGSYSTYNLNPHLSKPQTGSYDYRSPMQHLHYISQQSDLRNPYSHKPDPPIRQPTSQPPYFGTGGGVGGHNLSHASPTSHVYTKQSQTQQQEHPRRRSSVSPPRQPIPNQNYAQYNPPHPMYQTSQQQNPPNGTNPYYPNTNFQHHSSPYHPATMSPQHPPAPRFPPFSGYPPHGPQTSSMVTSMSMSTMPSSYGNQPYIITDTTISRQTSIIPPLPPSLDHAATEGRYGHHSTSMFNQFGSYNPAAAAAAASVAAQTHQSSMYYSHPVERSFMEFARNYTGPRQPTHNHLGSSYPSLMNSSSTTSLTAPPPAPPLPPGSSVTASNNPYAFDRWTPRMAFDHHQRTLSRFSGLQYGQPTVPPGYRAYGSRPPTFPAVLFPPPF